MIPLSRQAALIALMPSDIKGLRDVRSTETCLARPARVNLDEITPGAFSLVRDFIHKCRPSGIVDGLCQHSAGKSFDVQIFDGDQAVTVNNFTRFLVMKIGALLSDVRVRALQKLHG